MRADKINDRESFEAWLTARPSAKRDHEDIILAHRTAMRVLPAIISDNQQINSTTKAELIGVLWSSMVSRVASRRLTDEIQIAANHVEQINSRRNAGRASKRAVFAALYAVRLAQAADVQSVFVIDAAEEAAVGAATELILRNNNNSKLRIVDISVAASSAAYAAVQDSKLPKEYVLTAAAASQSIWDEIRVDAIWLETAARNSSLLDKPLWSNAPMWWEARSSKFLSRLQLSNLAIDRFDVWASWYSHTSNGTSIFGISSVEVRHDLERNIALGSTNGTFNQAFWKREPKDINADITRWVEEAQRFVKKESNTDGIERNTETLTDEDFRSKPASIQTMVRHGKVVLEGDDPLTDLQTQTAEAATKDLADGLRQIAEEARQAQADPRAVAFLSQCATAIEAAVHDQTKLFESGRNQKTLETYAATVDAEWGSLLSSRYSGLVAQFAQTLMRFDAWRAFVAKPVDSGEPIDPADMSNNVQAAVDALSKHEAAFSDAVLQRLHTLSNNFRLAVHRHQADDAAHPGWMQVPEVLQSDVAVSLSNVLLSYGQNILQHVGPKVLDGAMAAGDKTAFAAGALLVTAALGGALVYLQKKYPSLFGTVIKTIKKVRAIIKETEPE